MKYNMLFLSAKNSARSQMAETILNHNADDRFTAYSAGSNPDKIIHPMAIDVLTNAGFDMTNKKPKATDVYENMVFDFVITLCDSLKETCPVFAGHPIYAHWGMPDPEEFQGNDNEKLRFFNRTMLEIVHRINLFLILPFETIDQLAMELKVKQIGKESL